MFTLDITLNDLAKQPRSIRKHCKRRKATKQNRLYTYHEHQLQQGYQHIENLNNSQHYTYLGSQIAHGGLEHDHSLYWYQNRNGKIFGILIED